LFAFAFCVFIFAAPAFAQQPATPADNQLLEPVAYKTEIYPAGADAKKEIEAAVKRAGAEKKRILLVFGGNWCYDCHVLNKALHEGEAAKIMSESFLLVHVDIGEGEKNPELVKTYKIPLEKGVPAVAVLGADGRLLFSSSDGEFEAARRMMKRDLVTFLKYWQPPSKDGK
jgi:thioredoxin-related protein